MTAATVIGVITTAGEAKEDQLCPMVLPNYRLVVVSVLVFFLFYVHMYIYLHIDSFYYSYLITKCNQVPPRQRFREDSLGLGN